MVGESSQAPAGRHIQAVESKPVPHIFLDTKAQPGHTSDFDMPPSLLLQEDDSLPLSARSLGSDPPTHTGEERESESEKKGAQKLPFVCG